MATLINVKELSTALNLSRFRIYRMVEAGGIPHVRIGRTVRFDPDKVDRWLEKKSVPETEE